MVDPTLLSVAKQANEITKPYQKGFIQFCMINFFGKWYKNYIKKSIVLQGEAEIEAQQELENKIANIDNEPSPVLQQLHEDAEIEYRNIAGVLVRASNKVLPNANWNIDVDKLKRLKDLSKEFSSDDMQDIIAWILAWEYNKPWSFSLQTMSIIKDLSKIDLELFQKVCGLVINNWFLFSDILSWNAKDVREEYKIHYLNFLHLHELWLVNLNKSSIEVGTIDTAEGKIWQYMLDFWRKRLFIRNKNKINFSVITLTKAWQEIMSLLDIQKASQKYCDWVENKVKSKNVEIEWLKTEK